MRGLCEKVTDDHDYKPYLDAVKQGYLKESEIDTALTRLFTARMKLGMFDPPEMVPYTKIDEKLLDSAEHRAMALQAGQRVDGAAEERRRAAAEDNGHQDCRRRPAGRSDQVLLGNYNGIPTHTVSILEGLKKEFPGATIDYVAGTEFLGKEAGRYLPSC